MKNWRKEFDKTFQELVIQQSSVKEFIENGGDIKDLYTGKFNINDLEDIKKISGLIRPKLLPKWLK